METITVKAKAWGNSVGVILPKSLGIKPEEEITIRVSRQARPAKVRDLWGLFKGSKLDTRRVLAELRNEEW